MDSCPNEPKCERSDYKIREAMSADGQISPLANESTLLIQVERPEVQQIVDNVSDIFPAIFLLSDLLLNIVSTSRAGSRAGRVSPQSQCACQ